MKEGSKKHPGRNREKMYPITLFSAHPDAQGNFTVQHGKAEAMTRFELVIKGFADPWLRPLTHIAGKKHPGHSEEKNAHTHPKVPT